MPRARAIAILALGLAAGAPATAAEPPPQQRPALLTADTVSANEKEGTVTATGHVEIVQGDRVLLADTVTYNQRTNTVTASGNVSLLEPTGEVIFADDVQLTDDMREGTIRNLRIRLTDNSLIAAAGGRRVGGVETEMRKAVYSPCELCKDKPEKPPLWQVRAHKVIHDQRTHDVEYYDAFLDMFGWPILYAPYLSHPDPTVKRRSGLLAPTWGDSRELGVFVGVPYYFAFAPDHDLVLTPIVTQRKKPVLSTEYRQRFVHGELDLAGSITQSDRNVNGFEEHDAVRGHIRGRGRYDINDNWRTGFDLARASDDTYLTIYRFPHETNMLTTRGYFEGFRYNDYAAVNFYTFQGLRPEDSTDRTPLVAPTIDFNIVTEPSRRGSFWSFDGNLMSLTRAVGPDSHRLSFRGGWHLPFIGESGNVFEIAATTEGDLYMVDDVPDTDHPGQSQAGATGRIFPQIAFQWRYPLVRRFKTQYQLIEPMAALVAAPEGENPNRIPNEDSQSFDFDDADMFSPSRFTGIDRADSGQRVDYGLQGGLYGSGGGRLTAFLGQSYRFHENSPFTTGTGLEDRLSDIVGRVEVTLPRDTMVNYWFRLDKDELNARRNEVRVVGGPRWLRLNLDYVFLNERSGLGGFAEREDIRIGASSRLTDYWSITAGTRHNFTGAGTLSYNFGAIYEDECFQATASYVQRYYRDREIKPSHSILFRFVFKTLGEIRT